MTLLDRILARGVELPMDPIIAARLERHLRRIQPDPLFRRRLRGQVLNRYVAAREGLVPPPARPAVRREMGRLGRGVLYASLLTAMSVTAVGAASQNSLPGDALYGIKLELEAIRMQVAPPSLRDDLAILALDQRLREVELLAEAGRWALVDEAAARALEAEDALAWIIGSDSASGASRSEEARQRHADRLAELMASAPASARDGLERALEASTADGPPAVVPEPPSTGGTPGANSGGSNSGGTNSGGTNSGTNTGGTDSGGTDSGGNQDDDGDDDDTQGGVQGENPDEEPPVEEPPDEEPPDEEPPDEEPTEPSEPSKHAPSTH